MKKMQLQTVSVQVPVAVEADDSGFAGYLGRRVKVFATNYIFSGTLAGVNNTHILLDKDAGIVYETGPLDRESFADFQSFGHEIRIPFSSIEAFGPVTHK